MEKLDLLRFFDSRIYSSDTIFRKPHRRIYQIAVKSLGVRGFETIMVGDKLRQDVRGPGRIGALGIFKRGITNRKKRVPSDVLVIENISELPDLIKQGAFY